MTSPSPIPIGESGDRKDLPNEVNMPLVDHLEELRQRDLLSLLAVVIAAFGSLIIISWYCNSL